MKLSEDGTLMVFDVAREHFRPAILRDVVLLNETVTALVRKHASETGHLFTPEEKAARDVEVEWWMKRAPSHLRDYPLVARKD